MSTGSEATPAKAAIKLHTLLDLRGNIPTFIHISDGKLHDVNVLDLLLPEPGAYYARTVLMNRLSTNGFIVSTKWAASL